MTAASGSCTKFGTLYSFWYSVWKTGVSEAEIGGIIQDHSASTTRPRRASASTHFWNFSVAV